MRKRILLFVCIAFLFSGCAAFGNSTEPTGTETKEPTEAMSDPNDQTEGTATLGEEQKAVLNQMFLFLLPGMSTGEFDERLGVGGGVPLLDEDKNVIGNVEILSHLKGIFEDGKLVGMQPVHNHASFVSDFITVDSGAPCILAEYEFEVYSEAKPYEYIEDRRYWYAFWAVEGKKPVYGIWLEPDAYTLEDLKVLAQSVSFTEAAFADKFK